MNLLQNQNFWPSTAVPIIIYNLRMTDYNETTILPGFNIPESICN